MVGEFQLWVLRAAYAARSTYKRQKPSSAPRCSNAIALLFDEGYNVPDVRDFPPVGIHLPVAVYRLLHLPERGQYGRSCLLCPLTSTGFAVSPLHWCAVPLIKLTNLIHLQGSTF